MPLCEICEKEVETVYTCEICETEFCSECGSVKEKICFYCTDVEDEEEEEKPEW